ncbi:MAG: DNA polymerase I [Oscillospiraceae bacterium]|nr:DNA polymerase I [Oscillospiraceae bacterium]
MKLMILDGNSLINRAFYGVRPLTTGDGLHTHAVYGFLMILNKLLREDEPEAVCCAFDRKAPTFRHALYDGYKGTRKPMPEELAEQLPWLKQVLDALGIPRFEMDGWEADDLLGTLADRCAREGWESILVTGDRDSLQLISPSTRVRLITSKPGRSDSTLYNEELFTEEYGFPPPRLVDLKALMGDSSDNIPGVPGVGSKTASDLLRTYGSLEAVYAHLEELKPAVAKKLEAGRDSALLSYRLAVISREAPVELDSLDRLLRKEPDRDALYTLFTRLEFTRLMETYGVTAPAPSGEIRSAGADWREGAPEEILAACRKAEKAYFVCSRDLTAFAVLAGEGAFILREPDPAFLRAFFAPDLSKAGDGLKDLMTVLLERGIPFGGFTFDAGLCAWLLDPTDGNYTLPRIAKKLLDRNLPEAGYDAPGVWEGADASAALEALKLHGEALRDLEKHILSLLEEQGLMDLFLQAELPLCPVLAGMEHTGFAVDREALTRFGETLGAEIEQLQNSIYAQAGGAFNLNSTRQLGAFLFDQLGLPPLGKTKSGYSTNIEVLEKLRSKHPVVEEIIRYRQLSKLKSTYADGLVKVISPDGRIRTRFHMTATATGRLSSSDPNLQNIPVRTELGGEVRKMFVASPGCVLVDADYSQIELRILSHLSGDKVMQQAFRDGEDIHRATAAQVFGIEPYQVTGLMRSRAKAVNFGIVYGISDFSLAQDLHITRSEARAYMDSYLERFSGVRAYMKETVERAKRDGYAVTLFGRRRYLPELSSSNYNLRSFGERVALNMPVQGTAADIIKLAMVRVDRRFREELPQARLLLQVHDELIAECPPELAEKAARLLEAEMSAAAELDVPLLAEAHIGASWYDAK